MSLLSLQIMSMTMIVNSIHERVISLRREACLLIDRSDWLRMVALSFCTGPAKQRHLSYDLKTFSVYNFYIHQQKNALVTSINELVHQPRPS